MKRCENCEHWVKIYISSIGENIDEDSPSRTDFDKITEFGRCKKTVFLNETCSDKEEISIDDCVEKGIKMFVEDGEGYFAALYTHKDHCCRCWESRK